MKDVLRKKPVGCVGISITDTTFRFIEFTAPGTDLLLVGHGTVGIAYDAVEQGVVVSIPELTASIKQLRSQTTSEELVFPSWGDVALDERWKELLMIGGFSRVTAVPTARAIDHATINAGGESVPVVLFTSPTTVTLYYSGGQLGSYTYPFDIDGILDLQDAVTKYDNEPLRLLGDFGDDADQIEVLFSDYEIPGRLPNVWRQCFDVTVQVPPIAQSESYTYAWAVAMAHYGARYTFDSGEQHLSNNVLKKLMTSSAPAPTESEPTVEGQEPAEETVTEIPADPKPEIASQIEPTPDVQPATGSLRAMMDQQGETVGMTPESREEISRAEPVAGSVPEQVEPASTAPTPNAERSVWLRDVDEMIYKMMGKK